MSTTLSQNWIELKTLPYSTRSEIKLTYVKLKSIERLNIAESKDDDGEEQHHVFVLAQGTKYLYKTEKTYTEAEQAAKDLIATVENPVSPDQHQQDDKEQKSKLRLVSSNKE
ncbi:MAG TPA: hypothetical protein ENJ33_07065 [Thiothrix sp.]|nr:hypothetical protein [Thiothrix sp.]